ncbi:MAG: PKD domain-containing protein [Bacteroidales bacterium]|nr:PKD domain-containing protein [Bacteroidales bacterium]
MNLYYASIGFALLSSAGLYLAKDNLASTTVNTNTKTIKTERGNSGVKSETTIKTVETASPNNAEATLAILPSAEIFISRASGCAPLNVKLSAGLNHVDQYQWYLSDGTNTSLKSFDHTFVNAGEYEVELKIKNKNGSNTIKKVIKVLNPALAKFGLDSKKSDKSSRKLAFSNQSQHAERFEWHFGDGATSTEKSPEHTYKIHGQLLGYAHILQ